MEAGNQSNGASANEAIPCGKRLEGRPPGRGVATDALGLHTSMETDIAKAKRGPCYKARNCAQVLKPGEGLCRTAFSKT